MSESFTAIICTGEPGGPQSIQNWHLARALAARGHRIDLVCDGRRDDLVGMCDGLRVATWPSRVPGRLTDYRFFHRLVRRRQPDAVIGNFQSVNVALPIAAALGVPTRIAWHRSLSAQTPLDYPRPRAVQWIQDRLKAFVLAQATHVVAVSPAGQRDAIAAYGVPAARCQTVFHTCRPDPLRLLAATPLPDPEWRRIAYLGRVAPSKGIDVLLLALRRLRDREPWWPLALDIVGDGAARPALAALA
ncbi:MAG: glycosyltransferase family 4 protein, partial [Planctomycetota bacterium]